MSSVVPKCHSLFSIPNLSLKHIPCLPCRLFSFSNKSGYCVTACECVEKRESSTSWPKRPYLLMKRNPPKVFSFFEGNPEFIDMKINENRYSQDNNICVWTTDGYVFVACNCCMFGVKKHMCVSFFVIARCKIFCIDVTLADNNVIFTYNDYRISICCDDLISQKSKQFSFVLIAPFGGLELSS